MGGIQLIDTFLYGGKRYLDLRQQCASLEELAATPEETIPEGFLKYCEEDGCWYIWRSGEDPIPVIGKWRKFAGGSDARKKIVYRGEWVSAETYYNGETLNPRTLEFEWSLVEYYGCQWLCAKTGTQNPPSWDSTDWTLYLGDPRLRLEWAGSEDSVMEDNPEIELSVRALIANQDITDNPRLHWDWTRESVHNGLTDSASDSMWNASHSNFGSGTIFLRRKDMNYAFGKHPERLVFTVTATVMDPVTGEPGTYPDGLPTVESMRIEM